ncbi:transcriptional regulator [Latilactobacillus graminis DSM 20719]|uniref:Transcriptional regulator n=2 Tax=Latilactobacillus graminis TaxID=60519 RepID=A0AA89I8A1_9LACO|nr:transcriptional regulator [Latilactobacillus graminis DSM 20719]
MILDEIEQQYKHLSKQQRLIADYLLTYPKDVLSQTSKEIGERSGVSAATVVRFVQQIGLDNFSELKIAIATQLSSGKTVVDTVIEKNDTPKILSEKLAGVYESTVQKSYSMLNIDNLTKSLTLINKAKRVYLLGIGTSGLIAYDLYHKFNRYGIKTFYETDAHMNLEFLANATEQDIVIAISYSGKTKEVLIGAEFAHNNGIPVVSITREDTALSLLSDICLFVPDNERIVRVAAVASKLSTMFIADLVFMGIMQLRFGEMSDAALQTNRIITKLEED